MHFGFGYTWLLRSDSYVDYLEFPCFTYCGFLFSFWFFFTQTDTNMTKASIVADTSNKENLGQSSRDAAFGLFSLPNLRSLTLWAVQLDESFYTGVAEAAPFSHVRDGSAVIRDKRGGGEAFLKRVSWVVFWISRLLICLLLIMYFYVFIYLFIY